MQQTSKILLTSTNNKLLKTLLVIIASSLLVAMFVPTNILMFILFSWRIQLLLLLSLMIFFNNRNETLYALAIGSFYISPLVSYVYFNVANAPILIGLSLSVMLITIFVNYLVMHEKHSLDTMTKTSALSRYGKSTLISLFVIGIGVLCFSILSVIPLTTVLYTASFTFLAMQMIYLRALNILFDVNNQTKNNKAPSVAAMSLFADPLNISTKQQTLKDNVFTRLVKLIWSIITQVFQIPDSVFYYFRYKSYSDLALYQVPEAVKLDHPDICLAAVQKNGWALQFVPKDVQMAHPDIPLAAVQKNGWALQFVPKDVQMAHPDIPLAAVQKNWKALQLVPKDLKGEKLCMTAIQQNGLALEYVPEDVQRANPGIPLAAVKQTCCARLYVPEELKTNVEALAKLYTTSEEQLIIDLKLLRVKNEIICRVLSHLSFNIARELLQNNINSDVLEVLQEHITTESKNEGVVYHPAPYLYDIKQYKATWLGSYSF